MDPIKSDPILKDILIEGVNSVIRDREFPFHLFPVCYQSLCCSQANIGWLNLLHGFISSHGIPLQDAYFCSHGMSDHCGRPGVLSVMNTIWSSLRDLWQFRNEQRHGKEMAEQESEQIFTNFVTVFSPNIMTYHPSLDEHLSEPTTNLMA